MSLLCDNDLHERIEADLRSEYGVCLTSFYKREMTIRELYVLISQLPESARLVRELRFREDGNKSLWDTKEHLMVSMTNLLLSLDYSLKIRNAGEKNYKEVPLPEPMYAPGYEPELVFYEPERGQQQSISRLF